MSTDFESLLHPRVATHCLPLYVDSHYKHAALEGMTQVEVAIKEKSEVQGRFGVNLVTALFGNSRSIKLRVPFGDDMQKYAEVLFKGAFGYYRNYCAHDGTKVDARTCARIMVLASELLDLVGASRVSFTDVGGVEGLVEAGTFREKARIVNLLNILDGFTLPDDGAEWLEDDLLKHGYTFTQVEALLDIGLVEYISQDYVVPVQLLDIELDPPDTVGWFRLTDLGRKIAEPEQVAR